MLVSFHLKCSDEISWRGGAIRGYVTFYLSPVFIHLQICSSYEKGYSDDFVNSFSLIIFTECAMLSEAFAFMAFWLIDFIILSVRESILSMNSVLFFSIVKISSARILAIATIALFLPTLLTKLRYLALNFFDFFIAVCDAVTRKNLLFSVLYWPFPISSEVLYSIPFYNG